MRLARRCARTARLWSRAAWGRSRYIPGAHPKVLAVTGPHQYEAVLDAVHAAVPPQPDPFIDLLPASGVSLTPRHYSYLKISEGCNHRCQFCIIPDMRGRLVSRPAHAIVREAEKLVEAGVGNCWSSARTLRPMAWTASLKPTVAGPRVRTISPTWPATWAALGAWVRLHYVYPYPHVRDLIPLMAEGLVLPYLDIPFQHAHPDVLRPHGPSRRCTRGPLTKLPPGARSARTSPCDPPSSWAIPAKPRPSSRPCWTGWTRRNWTGSAPSSTRTSRARGPMSCPTCRPEAVKQDRFERFMEKAQAISEAKLAAKVGSRIEVIVDPWTRGPPLPHQGGRPRNRRQPVHRRRVRGAGPRRYRDRDVDEAGEYDLWGRPPDRGPSCGTRLRVPAKVGAGSRALGEATPLPARASPPCPPERRREAGGRPFQRGLCRTAHRDGP